MVETEGIQVVDASAETLIPRTPVEKKSIANHFFLFIFWYKVIGNIVAFGRKETRLSFVSVQKKNI